MDQHRKVVQYKGKDFTITIMIIIIRYLYILLVRCTFLGNNEGEQCGGYADYGGCDEEQDLVCVSCPYHSHRAGICMWSGKYFDGRYMF